MNYVMWKYQINTIEVRMGTSPKFGNLTLSTEIKEFFNLDY